MQLIDYQNSFRLNFLFVLIDVDCLIDELLYLRKDLTESNQSCEPAMYKSDRCMLQNVSFVSQCDGCCL